MVIVSLLLLLLVGICIYLADRLCKTNKAFDDFKVFNTFTNVVPRRQYMTIKKYLEEKKSIFSRKSRYELHDMINSLLLMVNDNDVSSYVGSAFQSSVNDNSMSDTEHKKKAIVYLDKLIESDTLDRETFKEMIYHIFCIINK